MVVRSSIQQEPFELKIAATRATMNRRCMACLWTCSRSILGDLSMLVGSRVIYLASSVCGGDSGYHEGESGYRAYHDSHDSTIAKSFPICSTLWCCCVGSGRVREREIRPCWGRRVITVHLDLELEEDDSVEMEVKKERFSSLFLEFPALTLLGLTLMRIGLPYFPSLTESPRVVLHDMTAKAGSGLDVGMNMLSLIARY